MSSPGSTTTIPPVESPSVNPESKTEASIPTIEPTSSSNLPAASDSSQPVATPNPDDALSSAKEPSNPLPETNPQPSSTPGNSKKVEPPPSKKIKSKPPPKEPKPPKKPKEPKPPKKPKEPKPPKKPMKAKPPKKNKATPDQNNNLPETPPPKKKRRRRPHYDHCGRTTCPRCKWNAKPKHDTTPDNCTHFVGLCFILICLPFFCFIPYCCNCFGYNVTRCPNCGKFITRSNQYP